MSTYSAFEKCREAQREVEMRKEVYGRNAPGGVIPPTQQRRIAIMEEIAEDYRILAEKERLL